MAQETQYWSFKYIFGTLYSGKTEASEISPVFDHVRKFGLPCKPYVLSNLYSDSISISLTIQERRSCRRTDSGRLDHVTDGESLDCLIFWRASRTVTASNWVDVTTSGLVTSAATGSSAKIHEKLGRYIG
jgi:hypothetical protein